MKDVRFIVTLQVPDETDPGVVLSELSGYLPDALSGPTWRYANVELAAPIAHQIVMDLVDPPDEGGGGPVPRLEGDNIVKSWRYRGPGR